MKRGRLRTFFHEDVAALLAIAGIMAVVCGPAQTFQDGLLPKATHISGIVTDEEGKAVAAAQMDISDVR